MPAPELAECLWLPITSRRQLADLQKQYTVNVYALDGTLTEVHCYRLDREGYIGIPRASALKSISNVTDKRRRGAGAALGKIISLYDYQEPFVRKMQEKSACLSDFICKAPPGKGKTVMALAFAQRLGRRTIVVVDQENLLTQWVERAKQHMGLTDNDIGIVQGPTATFEDKELTICMMQTLVRRKMPEHFYNYFGLVIFDESHSAGAPTFSKALMMFSAKTRIGLSATPQRSDALQKALTWSLGNVEVEMDVAHNRSLVYVLRHPAGFSERANASKMVGGFITEQADHASRNLLIAKAVKWLADSGRVVLVISDRIEQLCGLMAVCELLGVPKDSMGLYAKSRMVFKYEKDPRPKRRPPHLEKGAEYTPVRLGCIQKTIKKAELDVVKDTANVIFATYGVMQKGVDVPRLSAGIDATSRSSATQVHGRVLRENVEGKLRPIWVTIEDFNSYRSLYQLLQRIPEYVESNAEILEWQMDKGVRALDVLEYQRELKSLISSLRPKRITTSAGASSTS